MDTRELLAQQNGKQPIPVDDQDRTPTSIPVSIKTAEIALEAISMVKPPLVLPDGSTNLHAGEQMINLIAARQELLAILTAHHSEHANGSEG